ncbi:Uncharacterised protein [Neisseria meningitidis]|nr:Uncharacterised protein [Neisseria meningitidis]CWO99721.1 Uncharacterised protein [Neisseria meningitidis]CWP23477.1 Uncharacterised protein [Neisseria meningitidis]CWS33153.1 Uncharacterised protein [Neisseria meningitidis]CWT17605.1 Uncharacterised protein [Neisseria meningitidis]
MFGKRTVCQFGIVAEEFCTVVDDAVAVQIAHKQTVIGSNPTCGGADALIAVVEQCTCKAFGSDSFYAVAVQI